MNLDERVHAERAQLEAGRLWRRLLPLERARGGGYHDDKGQPLLCFSSNDYLGLASHRQLAESVAQAARDHGTSTSSSRLLAGTAPHHALAEQSLAQFVQQPAAALFSSGFAANTGAIPALVGREDLILSDTLNHASLIDGCRLSRATIERFPHLDISAVRSILNEQRHRFRHALVVTDALFSMDGDAANLSALSTLCREYDAWLYVDEAHSLGVLGPQGRGLAVEAGVQPEVTVGTLGKSFGLHGAFVAASSSVIEFFHNRARSFVFSTAVPPVLSAAIPTAVGLVQQADDRRRRLVDHAQTLRQTLRNRNQHVLDGPGPILPWILSTPAATLEVSQALRARGILAQAVRPPTVPDGTSRIRLVPTAAHSETDICSLSDAIRAVAPPQ